MLGSHLIGFGVFRSAMIRVSIAYGALMTVLGLSYIALPHLSGPMRWFFIGGVPMHLCTGLYFAWWMPGQRRVTKHAKAHGGSVCWNCGYPHDVVSVGMVCSECGYAHTESNIQQLMATSGRWRRGVVYSSTAVDGDELRDGRVVGVGQQH